MFASSRALERGGWKMEDDFEGLLWVLVWCIKGELPWQSLVSSSKAFKKDSQRYLDYHRRRLPFIAELALPDKLDKFRARFTADRGAVRPDAALYAFFRIWTMLTLCILFLHFVYQIFHLMDIVPLELMNCSMDISLQPSL